jgi:LPS-assembly lipoprotein
MLIRLLLSVSITILLPACGFHLRQADSFPASLSLVSLECHETSVNVCQSLERNLYSAGITPQALPEAYKIEIGKAKQSQQAVSVDNKARAAEYEITRTIPVSLIHPSGKKILQTTTSRSQHYRYTEESVLAKQREANDIVEQIDQLLALAIFQQLKPFTEVRIQEALTESK